MDPLSRSCLSTNSLDRFHKQGFDQKIKTRYSECPKILKETD